MTIRTSFVGYWVGPCSAILTPGPPVAEEVSDPVHSVLEDFCKKLAFGITKEEKFYGWI